MKERELGKREYLSPRPCQITKGSGVDDWVRGERKGFWGIMEAMQEVDKRVKESVDLKRAPMPISRSMKLEQKQ